MNNFIGLQVFKSIVDDVFRDVHVRNLSYRTGKQQPKTGFEPNIDSFPPNVRMMMGNTQHHSLYREY